MEAHKSSHEGRRPRQVINRWKEILRPYWASGINAQAGWEATKRRFAEEGLPTINPRTVRVYWREWAEQYEESMGKEQAEREANIKTQAQAVLDKQLLLLQNAQNDLETSIKQKKEVITEKNGYLKLSMSSYIHQERRALTQAVADLLRLKIDIVLSPTLTDKLEQEIDSFILKTSNR